jgi:hypothetical protein
MDTTYGGVPFIKSKVVFFLWDPTILLRKPQLDKGDHMEELGIELETSRSLEDLKESRF